MVKLVDVLFAVGRGGFFYDDQAAIRAGATSDGFIYRGVPVTDGFSAIRIPATALSLGLLFDNGFVAWGDMMNVQYCGGSGREPPLDPAAAKALVTERLRQRLLVGPVHAFRANCDWVLERSQGRLPLAVEYGVSQALLRAAAHATGFTVAEVVCEAFELPLIRQRVPLYAQSGDDRRANVDKMILKGVDILPHGLINSRSKFGERGEVFLDYVDWVARRVEALGAPAYKPKLHFDIYGWAGLIFGHDLEALCDFLLQVEERAAPYRLHVESPADFGSRDAQIVGFVALRHALERRGSNVRIVADEWCNTLEDIRAFASAGAGHILQIKMPDVGSVSDTIEAAIACRKAGMEIYIGGSCVETDLSAQVSAHIAVAVQADMLLAKPGMGVDEAITITDNEQERLLALLNHKAVRREEFEARQRRLGLRGPSS